MVSDDASRHVAVLGAGAWGTALAVAVARGGRPVTLWGWDRVVLADMALRRENVGRLPGIMLPSAVAVTARIDMAFQGAAVVVAAMPAQAIRAFIRTLPAVWAPDVPLVLCAKGIERDTGLFPSDVVRAERPGCAVAVLSGPSFAADVGQGLPTAVTIAAPDLALAASVGRRLGSDTLRLYHSDDVRGVEIGGAAKNILAIACGIAMGRGLGPSAVAALTARAFAELARFGQAYGARPDTLVGLSGLGDLVLTCGSLQSRNFSYGVALGRGEMPLSAARGAVVEGVWTAPVLVRLAAERGVEMPICDAVASVLDGTVNIDTAVKRLMRRPPRTEG